MLARIGRLSTIRTSSDWLSRTAAVIFADPPLSYISPHRPSTLRRATTLLVILGLLPQVVTPAFAARHVSLKWMTAWLVNRSAVDPGLKGAISEAQSTPEHSGVGAAYLADVLAHYARIRGPEGAGDVRDVVRVLSAQSVRAESPPVAPPAVLDVAARHADKFVNGRSPMAVRVIDAPLRRGDSRIVEPADANEFRGADDGLDPLRPRGP